MPAFLEPTSAATTELPTGFWRHFYTPRQVLGQAITLRQAAFALLLLACLTP
jgi:hypothetical protein